jgi:DNA polymerase I-like protein with 3'-5' exonuclease and polymerase domains
MLSISSCDNRLVEPEPQILVVADYSSLEVGVQGDFCSRLFGDDQILEMYIAQETKGLDIHCANAREVFGKWLGWVVPDYVVIERRRVACPYAGKRVDRIPIEEFKAHPYGGILRKLIKEIWYGLAYGKSAYGFATLIGADGKMIGERQALAMLNALLDAVPGMRKWMRWVEAFVRKHGGIYSLGGRWCDLSHLLETGDEWAIKAAYRKAYNFPMQATAADIMGCAMVSVTRCLEFIETLFRIFLQVHDELVTRGPERNADKAEGLLVRHMKNATANGTKLIVDLQVGSGRGYNYFDAK